MPNGISASQRRLLVFNSTFLIFNCKLFNTRRIVELMSQPLNPSQMIKRKLSNALRRKWVLIDFVLNQEVLSLGEDLGEASYFNRTCLRQAGHSGIDSFDIRQMMDSLTIFFFFESPQKLTLLVWTLAQILLLFNRLNLVFGSNNEWSKFLF